MTRTEARLREAFGAAASTVRKETLRPLPHVRPRRRHPWLVPVIAAATAAASIALTVLVAAPVGQGPASAGGGPRFTVLTRGFYEPPRGISRGRSPRSPR